MRHIAQIRRRLLEEMQPYPGRMSGTLQDVLSMLLALVAAETLRTPGMSLALALILLLKRENPGMTWRDVLQIFGGAATACVCTLVWVQLTDGTEVFRFIGFLLCVFGSAFCMSATRLPLFFTIFGFYGFVDLSGWDTHRATNAVVTTMLYNVASLGIAMGAASAVSYLFTSRHPAEELQSELNKRLELLAKFHRERASSTRRNGITELHHRVLQYAHAGDTRLNELYESLRSHTPEALPTGMHFRIGLLTRAMESSATAGFAENADRDGHRHIADLCESILDPSQPHPEPPADTVSSSLRDIFAELSAYNEAAVEGEAPTADKKPSPALYFKLFHSDAFSKPDSAFYALKLTLCATVCYVFYNAIAWPGILTCVVTVLFTGLSSTGAMKQKQLYRLVGAAIGGVLAILVESLLFPNMDSITSLVLVAGCVCLASAWVSRSPRIGYVGVQIAFAFFLADLPGFEAASQISPARDRVIGISLGVLVMWFVFDQLWPTRPSDALRAIRDRIEQSALAISKAHPAGTSSMRRAVSADLAQMQILLESSWFDFSRDHHRELGRSRRLKRQIEAAAATFYKHLHRTAILQEAIESHREH